jgi:thioredoxin 1
MANVQEVGESNWATEVESSATPVLVDFWAPWCAPCKALSPTVDAVAQEMEGKVKVVKCNIDDARPLAMKYDVRSIPVLMLFKNGRVVEQLVGGNQTKQRIVEKLETHLA